MSLRPLIAACLLLILVAGMGGTATAQMDPFEKVRQKKGPVEITADNVEYEKGKHLVRAIGHARAWQADFSMEADEIIYDDTAGRLEGIGHVVMREWESEYRADRMVFDTEKETGVLVNGEVILEPGNFQICGSRVEKLGGESYNVEDGSYTTCVCPPGKKPSWTLEGSNMKVSVGEHGSVSNARLKAKGIPVFYAPAIYFPAPRERQSGFLFPDVLWTSRKGFVLSAPFYWATAKNVDVTLGPRYMQKRGVGGDLEVRYILSRRGRGEAHLSYMNEFLFERLPPEDVTARRRRKLGEQVAAPSVQALTEPASLQRWEFRANHAQQWDPTFGSSASIHLLSDELYRELASKRLEERKPFTRSTVSTGKSWRATSTSVSVQYYQDLVPPLPPRCSTSSEEEVDKRTVPVDRSHGSCERIYQTERAVTYQRFPEVQFGTSLYDRDQAPVGLSLNSTVTHFYRFADEPLPEQFMSQASQPRRGYRMILTPGTGLPFDLGGYVNGSLRLEADQFAYYIPVFITGRTQTFSVLRPTVELKTALIRDFEPPFGRLLKVRHEVHPTVRYKLIQPFTVTGISHDPVEDRQLLEPPLPPDLPPEEGGGPERIFVGLLSFDGRDGAGEDERIEIELLNYFPFKYRDSLGREVGRASPFELKLTQPIDVYEIKRNDARKSGLRNSFESHYKYNLSGYQRQKQAERLGLLSPRRFPTQEVGDIVPDKEERQPLLPLRVEVRSTAIRGADIQLRADVDPYYDQELHEFSSFVGVKERFRFRRLGVKYTFTPRSTKPQNGPDPEKANRDNPFFRNGQFLQPQARFYATRQIVLGYDLSLDIAYQRPYEQAGRVEYYSPCGCWSAFVMGGRNLIGEREPFTLQTVVDEDGRPVFQEELLFQFGLNLTGLIQLGQNPED
ncbi:MAG: LPS-assembly protein LptD [Nitrospirae bacterium]|nr:LPS-assembly protein LptD [Nitrospirota bacterium]